MDPMQQSVESNPSICYAAPEVVRGEDHKYLSDIWSVGCVLLEMLTGKNIWADKL